MTQAIAEQRKQTRADNSSGDSRSTDSDDSLQFGLLYRYSHSGRAPYGLRPVDVSHGHKLTPAKETGMNADTAYTCLGRLGLPI